MEEGKWFHVRDSEFEMGEHPHEEFQQVPGQLGLKFRTSWGKRQRYENNRYTGGSSRARGKGEIQDWLYRCVDCAVTQGPMLNALS